MATRATQIRFEASAAAAAALADVGRSEDVRFSPGNGLLAIAGFARKSLLILRVRVSPGPSVEIDDFMMLKSDAIGYVHGLDFIDDETLVVANRDGQMCILPIPGGEPAGRLCQVAPIRTIGRGLWFKLRSPGSVAVRPRAGGLVSLYVCQNYAHRVSHHLVAPRLGYAQLWGGVAMRQGLDIPDGIAISADGRWIAVSSHGTHDVKLYPAGGPFEAGGEPAGVLSGAGYPHGLRFTPDGRHLIVADAGSPVLHIYSSDGDWQGVRGPARTVQVLDEERFRTGHHSVEEGGPKGLDIDKGGQLVAVTCEDEPLAFFSLGELVGEESALPRGRPAAAELSGAPGRA